jgi:hypothetical protein
LEPSRVAAATKKQNALQSHQPAVGTWWIFPECSAGLKPGSIAFEVKPCRAKARRYSGQIRTTPKSKTPGQFSRRFELTTTLNL